MKMSRFWLMVTIVLVAACSAQRTAPVIPVNTTSQSSKQPSGDYRGAETPKQKKTAPTTTRRRSALLPSSIQLLSEAEKSMRNGNISVASTKAERALRISPRAPEVYIKLAEVRVKQQRLSQAEQMLKKAVSLAGGNKILVSDIWLKIARVRDLTGNAAGAKSARASAAKSRRW